MVTEAQARYLKTGKEEQAVSEKSDCPDGYKLSEVGLIPNDWRVKPIGDVLSIRHGRSQKEVVRIDGMYPVLGTGGEIDRTNIPLYSKPSVLIGRKGTINKPRFIDTPFWTVDTLFYSEINEVNDAKFIFYKFCLIDWMSYNEASGVPSLNASTIENIPFSFPINKSEQTAIAKALSDVDALITSLEKLIAKKQAIKTATMQQLLTGKKRLPGFGEGKGYKQTELGEIPEDWDITKLGCLGEFKNGINKESSAFGHGSPLVNLMDVFGVSSITPNGLIGLVKSSKLEQKMYDLNQGDVIFIRSSVKPSGVGLTAVVEEDIPSAVFSGFLIRFRDKGNLDNQYKRHCFYEEGFRRRVIASSSVSANTNINQDSLKQLLKVFPSSKKEQGAIATVLSEMDINIEQLRVRLTKTQQIKQGMMQELLTGKTRLI